MIEIRFIFFILNFAEKFIDLLTFLDVLAVFVRINNEL